MIKASITINKVMLSLLALSIFMAAVQVNFYLNSGCDLYNETVELDNEGEICASIPPGIEAWMVVCMSEDDCIKVQAYGKGVCTDVHSVPNSLLSCPCPARYTDSNQDLTCLSTAELSAIPCYLGTMGESSEGNQLIWCVAINIS